MNFLKHKDPKFGLFSSGQKGKMDHNLVDHFKIYIYMYIHWVARKSVAIRL
jgi:hypothetical protein